MATEIATGDERKARITIADLARAILREPLVLLAVLFLLCLVIVAVFASWLAPYDPLMPNIFAGRLPPFSEAKGMTGAVQFHLLGTDALGRDMLTRLMYGAQASVTVGVVAAAISGTIGTVLGLLAGYYGGWAGAVIMRTVDGVMAVPSLLVALFVLFLIGGGLVNMVLIFVFVPVGRVRRVSLAASAFPTGSRRSWRQRAQSARPTGASSSGTSCRTWCHPFSCSPPLRWHSLSSPRQD